MNVKIADAGCLVLMWSAVLRQRLPRDVVTHCEFRNTDDAASIGNGALNVSSLSTMFTHHIFTVMVISPLVKFYHQQNKSSSCVE